MKVWIRETEPGHQLARVGDLLVNKEEMSVKICLSRNPLVWAKIGVVITEQPDKVFRGDGNFTEIRKSDICDFEHDHGLYALKSHEHEYALKDHQHNYADKVHNHPELAEKIHPHPELSEVSHHHDARYALIDHEHP